mgnify:CR=1 FL=1
MPYRVLRFSVFLICGCLWLLRQIAVADEDTVPEPVKPNILFIFADDLAFDCIGAYGNSEVQTPNLDRLAKRGTRFRQTYNMGGWGGAICVASRTMLNTGLSLWRANKVQKELTDTFVARKQMWLAP